MNKKALSWLFGILIALNLAIIWGNSALPAKASSSISGWLLDLMWFLPDSPVTHTILRKLAHFSEFALLGLLTGLLRIIRQGQPCCSLMGFGLAAACIDETIQRFVPGRDSSLIDVWIDAAGFAAGLILVTLGYHIYQHNKLRRNES